MQKVIASTYKELNGKIILLLIGGNKSSQQRDIKKAKELASQIQTNEK
jgi:putative addiction module killer protein